MSSPSPSRRCSSRWAPQARCAATFANDSGHPRCARKPLDACYVRAMANLDALQKEHEARLSALISEHAGQGAESDLALVRALVHRAMHLAAEKKCAEFCALATFLGEMIGHA